MNRKRTIQLILIAVLVGFILWLTISDFAQTTQLDVVQSQSDIAAWAGNVFIIQGNTLQKLDSRLEIIKTVTLQPGQPFLPPDPNIRKHGTVAPIRGGGLQIAVGPNSVATSCCVTADQNYVYVFYQGTIVVFDHNLNYIRSKIF